MDYEKKYKELVGEIRKAYLYAQTDSTKAVLEDIFPELAESEGEKVREELIKHLKEGAEGYEPAGCSSDYQRWLAWVEKQGQVKESTISQHENRTCKENDDSLTSEDERIRKRLIQLFQSDDEESFGEFTNTQFVAWLERQGEHANFRNKIQVGDKVTRNEDGVLVNLSQLKRVAKPSEKQCGQKFEMKTAEESLGIDSDTYNKIVDECIFGEQKTEKNKGNIGGISPTWSEEDEKNLRRAIRATKVVYPVAADWLQSLQDRVQPQPKQEWKQENTGDLTAFENAMMHIGGSFFGQHAGLDPNDTNSIKEQANLLLELVPSKEWSEEDEDYLFLLNSICKDAEEKYRNSPDVLVRKEIANARNWLNSLRPRSRWKPSEEQMQALWLYAKQNNYYGAVLTPLYKYLKKLKEGKV